MNNAYNEAGSGTGASENFSAVLRDIVADVNADNAVVAAAQKCLQSSDWSHIEQLMKIAKPVAGRDRLMSAYAWLVVEREA